MPIRCALSATLLLAALPAAAQQAVTSGPGIDYQPSILRAADGSLRLAFERLDTGFSGDLWITRSDDEGASWSAPAPVIGSSANERHPALLQLGDGSFVLFYLKGSSSFRLFRATSPDGAAFTEQGQLQLGCGGGSEINPHVIRHPDGTLTLSYQRLNSGSYVAQSSDGGASWDQLCTPIESGSQLPRIAYRPSDGRYLATYQVGSSNLSLHAETTTDVRNWSAPRMTLAAGGDSDNHDSLPVLLPDDRFVVFYIRSVDNGPYDIWSRRSSDAATFEPPLPQQLSAAENDVEPHPLVGASAATVQLYWGREMPPGSNDYDIVRLAAVPTGETIFADGFEPGTVAP